MLAAGGTSDAIVTLLLNRGSDVHRKSNGVSIYVTSNSQDGFTALHYAAESGTPKIVEILIESGADIEAESQV